MNLLLHDENLRRLHINGRRIEGWLRTRAAMIAAEAAPLSDPNVSILIRTRNDGQHIQRLFSDIKAQNFSGKIEIIVVDTNSRDDTIRYAKIHGARVITLDQEAFSYPKALNMGFKIARYPWVVTLVGHSSLSNRLFLKSLSYWNHRYTDLGGLYSVPLANWNASPTERAENIIGPTIWQQPQAIKKLSIGIMAANCSIVRRELWERLGGYDERYAGGGEDRAFAQTMLDHQALIIREPLCTVFHSHGLDFKNSLRQWLHWGEVGKKATTFETAKVHKRRPDLR